MRVGTIGLLASLAVAWTTAAVNAQEVRLRAVMGFPKQIIFIQQFEKWVPAFNASEAAKGVVQIQIVGGPEVTPVDAQPTAMRNGVFDLWLAPTAYALGQVPEGDALLGSNLTPAQARQRGGIDLVNKIYGERLNVQLVSWLAAGVGFHIYLIDPPKMVNGVPDLKGLKIRSTPIYKEWLEAMGATNVVMHAAEVYTALERKVVDGLAWPGVAFTDLSWQKFAKHRIDPPVWQLEVMLWANKPKWEGLPAKAREVLQNALIAHENEQVAAYGKLAADEREKLRNEGMTFHMLEGDARKQWVDRANAITWDRVKTRSPQHHADLRRTLFAE